MIVIVMLIVNYQSLDSQPDLPIDVVGGGVEAKNPKWWQYFKLELTLNLALNWTLEGMQMMRCLFLV